MANQQQQDEETRPVTQVSLRNFESLIDQQIREAEAAGQFSDLRGTGKPLDFGDDRDVPDELRVGFRMLKQAGYAPPWIELQKSIREEQAALTTWLARTNARWSGLSELDRARLREEYDDKLKELNRQISAYNLTAPPAAGQLPLCAKAPLGSAL